MNAELRMAVEQLEDLVFNQPSNANTNITLSQDLLWLECGDTINLGIVVEAARRELDSREQ